MQVNQDAQVRNYLLGKASHLGVPLSGAFELTPRCNFNCKMCYIRMTPTEMKSGGKELTTAQWLDIARQARQEGLLLLLLTGGEPLLRSDFPFLYEKLSHMGFSISINTNGSLLTAKMRELFDRLPPARINITLYGANAEDYGRLCAVPDAFEIVHDNISWLKESGINCLFNFTATPWNIESLPRVKEYAAQMGIPLRLTVYNFPPVRKADASGFSRLSAECAGKLQAEHDLACKDSDYLLTRACRELPVPAQGKENKMNCYGGKSQFWIAWNGKMTPCGMLNEPHTDPLVEGFLPAWQALKEKTAKIYLCTECAQCPKRETCISCAAIAVAETGRFDEKPEYMCRLNNSYREHIKKSIQENT